MPLPLTIPNYTLSGLNVTDPMLLLYTRHSSDALSGQSFACFYDSDNLKLFDNYLLRTDFNKGTEVHYQYLNWGDNYLLFKRNYSSNTKHQLYVYNVTDKSVTQLIDDFSTSYDSPAIVETGGQVYIFYTKEDSKIYKKQCILDSSNKIIGTYGAETIIYNAGSAYIGPLIYDKINNRILFTPQVANTGSIQSINITNDTVTSVINSNALFGYPSPDGTKICFLRNNNGYLNIHIADADGANIVAKTFFLEHLNRSLIGSPYSNFPPIWLNENSIIFTLHYGVAIDGVSSINICRLNLQTNSVEICNDFNSRFGSDRVVMFFNAIKGNIML
jgi:hypothetical protein